MSPRRDVVDAAICALLVMVAIIVIVGIASTGGMP